eukprot:CAMPEP_0179616892 /NCGR_PEP_ID=MMETSP0930-20121108/6868_1 /TAXON_ID=548131 ORGANISM="Ostreococcus mediterraneus, Strain clade-D-RCC1621" /NCGR_SAMPLE_ID=MMETSP0930 /ASSEMBLY_ACC=CAM_ASM_000580 /LENGTH=78 /DNA_ID=CAMNT_0021485761 /DNA_START=83 /DNA_END=319 /DNA_ORIENTATION=+
MNKPPSAPPEAMCCPSGDTHGLLQSVPTRYFGAEKVRTTSKVRMSRSLSVLSRLLVKSSFWFGMVVTAVMIEVWAENS